MKFLSTRICITPTIKNMQLTLSYDFNLWKSSYDINKIKLYYNDQFGLEITDENIDDFQPKNSHSLLFAEHDFLPCILSVEDKDYDKWNPDARFQPNDDAYKNARLIFLGYDVMDLCFISIKSHGISPEYERDNSLLNMFGLFKEYRSVNKYLEKNIKLIPEHEWKIVSIYTNTRAFDILNALGRSIPSTGNPQK
ncbi:hypothetical protein [Rodentibacter genomosp. 2]|uniref:Uncharacterized protein n=1 Tax=Rodentibacter genomosp. 2 TaxID=1908266 RepID=A0A1V3JT03_9PAST|nr:hypothetical protein [Rodentibacter genomosp. 2]OOF59569.1 hypothetical protein BKK55_00175 [Rodentibacter genomosp. 2]